MRKFAARFIAISLFSKIAVGAGAGGCENRLATFASEADATFYALAKKRRVLFSPSFAELLRENFSPDRLRGAADAGAPLGKSIDRELAQEIWQTFVRSFRNDPRPWLREVSWPLRQKIYREIMEILNAIDRDANKFHAVVDVLRLLVPAYTETVVTLTPPVAPVHVWPKAWVIPGDPFWTMFIPWSISQTVIFPTIASHEHAHGLAGAVIAFFPTLLLSGVGAAFTIRQHILPSTVAAVRHSAYAIRRLNFFRRRTSRQRNFVRSIEDASLANAADWRRLAQSWIADLEVGSSAPGAESISVTGGDSLGDALADVTKGVTAFVARVNAAIARPIPLPESDFSAWDAAQLAAELGPRLAERRDALNEFHIESYRLRNDIVGIRDLLEAYDPPDDEPPSAVAQIRGLVEQLECLRQSTDNRLRAAAGAVLSLSSLLSSPGDDRSRATIVRAAQTLSRF